MKSIIQRIGEFYRKREERSKEATRRAIEYNRSHRESRQVHRAKLRIAVFQEMNARYPGESRRVRRSMAFDLIRNQAKKARTVA